mgnify:CR=1 FL=1
MSWISSCRKPHGCGISRIVVRFVCLFMNRITFSCNDVTANELEWLSTRTMRKVSNLLAVLVAHEVQRQLETLTEVERAEVYAQLTEVRVTGV